MVLSNLAKLRIPIFQLRYCKIHLCLRFDYAEFLANAVMCNLSALVASIDIDTLTLFIS